MDRRWTLTRNRGSPGVREGCHTGEGGGLIHLSLAFSPSLPPLNPFCFSSPFPSLPCPCLLATLLHLCCCLGLLAFPPLQPAMASSTNPDDEFLFPDDDDEPQPDTTRSSAASSPVIPNFRGKLPEPEVPDSKGPLKVFLFFALSSFSLHPLQFYYSIAIPLLIPPLSSCECDMHSIFLVPPPS